MNINLLNGCERGYCLSLATAEWELLNQPQYSEGVSVMPIPEDVTEHLVSRRTFRKRVLRAGGRGYHVRPFEPREHYEDMLAINRSTPERQGRKMDGSYWNLEKTFGAMLPVICHQHHPIMYGAFLDQSLYGYSSIIRSGELVHVSQFLGHAYHLSFGVMYLLMAHILESEQGVLFYNRHDSGGDGLRWFKERIGLTAGNVEWTL